MVLLDSNIFIYLANGQLKRQLIAHRDIAYASITRIECLGYMRLEASELLLLGELFGLSYNLALTEAVVERAIRLRQSLPLSLGDSIIAATALESDCELWTANGKDFANIEGLRLRNPLVRTAQ